MDKDIDRAVAVLVSDTLTAAINYYVDSPVEARIALLKELRERVPPQHIRIYVRFLEELTGEPLVMNTREQIEAFSREIQPALLASKRREWVEQCLQLQEETSIPAITKWRC